MSEIKPLIAVDTKILAPARKKHVSVTEETQPQDEFKRSQRASTSAIAVEKASAPPTKAPVKVADLPAVPKTLSIEEPPPVVDSEPIQRVGPLGPGFPAASNSNGTMAARLHNFLAHKLSKPYDWAVTKVLDRVSDATRKGIGVDVKSLLDVERTLFQGLAPSTEGYLGGSAPLFQSLANGQAAYVSLGVDHQNESDHLMRMFAGLPLSTIQELGGPTNDLSKVRELLLERAKTGQFPVYVDMDGKFGLPTPSESIATESIASIARRENSLGDTFPDPRQYYKWLLTRVESAYRRLDPWLFGINPTTHSNVEVIKTSLTPPWLENRNADPLGFAPEPKKTEAAYKALMRVAGDGQPPTWETFTNIADTAVALDRDLLSGVQTYWIKLFREIGPEQRESLMTPAARAWVSLNTAPPGTPEFSQVSPDNAPYLEMVEKKTGNKVEERYDRSMALSQAVDHLLDGLGIEERRKMLSSVMTEVRSKEDLLVAREERLRKELGSAYNGLDVKAILSGEKDLSDPEVKTALDQLRAAAQPKTTAAAGYCEMTTQHAEIIRHRDLMDWVAGRYSKYGDIGFKHLTDHFKTDSFSKDPLILGEFFIPPAKGTQVTPLSSTPSKEDILGRPVPGKEPVKMSIALEGGGGKGFAYVEALKQVRDALNNADGQVAVDEFVGNSAGALTAGLLAGGYNPDEMGEVLKKLDFKSFYSDFLWLEGGVDPKVRGIDRTGIFSTQKMYNTLSDLLKAKTGVEGRPVLFRDLPYKLKVTSTMLNSDLPDELKARLNVSKDGQTVFSFENTPNMDVAAAMCASAAVPGFFNAPQLQVCQDVNRQGEPVLQRMQMVDGGAVNNFPVAEAGSKDEKSFLVNMPTYFRAPSATPGGPPIELSMLNFDSSELAAIDEYNREQYKAFKPALGSSIQKIAAQGYDRAVLGLNLSTIEDVPAPILQGQNRQETEKILSIADQTGLPHLDAQVGADRLAAGLNAKKHGYVEQLLLNTLLDKDDTFKPGLFTKPAYHPQKHEAQGLSDLIAAMVAVQMTAPSYLQERLFEKA